MNRGQKFSVWYFLIALIAAWLFSEYIYKPYTESKSEVPYSEFLADLSESKIENADITDSRIIYTLKENVSPDKRPIVGGKIFTGKRAKSQDNIKSAVRLTDPFLIERLASADIKFGGVARRDGLIDLIMGIILPIYSIIDMVETAENVWSDSTVCAITDHELEGDALFALAHLLAAVDVEHS